MWKNIWTVIDGHKTDLIAGALFVLGILIFRGMKIPEWLLLLIGSASFVALRDAIRKIEKKK